MPQKTVQSRQLFSFTLTAACINAAMLSLLDASSFPLKAVVCAAAAGSSPESNEMVLNPQVDMEFGGCFVFLFGADDECEQTIWTDWKTTVGSADLLKKAREVAREGARKVYERVKQSIGLDNAISMQID
jgi:ribonuclease PH